MGSHSHAQQLLWDTRGHLAELCSAGRRCQHQEELVKSRTAQSWSAGRGGGRGPATQVEFGHWEGMWSTAGQKPLCDEHWQSLALLLIVQLSQQHGNLHGERAGNVEKGETPQVAFFTQVRVKFRDSVWILYNEGRESLRRYLCNF